MILPIEKVRHVTLLPSIACARDGQEHSARIGSASALQSANFSKPVNLSGDARVRARQIMPNYNRDSIERVTFVRLFVSL